MAVRQTAFRPMAVSRMADLATITLGAVVLDRPDRTGVYIARDFACGWAYLVVDDEGDSRFRGQGTCEGGLGEALRRAFLAALDRVRDCGQIKILVESKTAHQAMTQFALENFHVIAAIAGRPVMIMTRPLERSSFHVRSAAERVAEAALRDRERFSGELAPGNSPSGDTLSDGVFSGMAPLLVADPAPAAVQDGRRTRRGTASAGPVQARPASQAPLPEQAPPSARAPSAQARPPGQARLGAFAAMRRLVHPVLAAEADAPLLVPLAVPLRKGVMNAWLNEFDSRVSDVSAGLREMEA